MNLSMIYRHHGLYFLSVATLLSGVAIPLFSGLHTPLSNVEWTDVIGEGCIAFLTIAWIFAALVSRPPGKITTLLVIGLTCFMFSALLDMMDEFVDYPISVSWVSILEPIPAAIGMVIMSFALLGWHEEQLALNRQLRRKELFFRNHEHVDSITQLYPATYWHERALKAQRFYTQNAIVVVDVNNFAEANRRYGVIECNRYLYEIAHIILMNIGESDLACRYAGDRFVVLLPNASKQKTDTIARHIKNSISHVAFKNGDKDSSVFHTVRTVCHELLCAEKLYDVMIKLNEQLNDNPNIIVETRASNTGA